MRHLALLPFLLLVACGDPVSTEPPAEEPTGPLYTLSGVVVDSMTGQGIPGARVVSGVNVGYADAGGQWSLEVPGGVTSVTTSPVGYERATFTFTVVSNAYFALLPRRLAPFVQECVRDGEYIHALVTDLQGRKTIERWEQSEAFVRDTAGEHRIGAANWTYLPLDYLTYEVTLGPVAPDASAVRWNVYDSDAHLFAGVCEPSDPPPPPDQ